MSAPPKAAGPQADPGVIRERQRPTRTAVAGQTALIVLTMGSLLLSGSRLGPWVYPAVFGAPLVVAAYRRDGAFRLWAIYAISFVVFVQLRAVADDVGTPVHFDYVIVLDRLLGLGELPTVRLQAFGPGLAGLAVGVHLTYYIVPPLVGAALWFMAPARFRRYMLAISGVYMAGLAIHFLLPTAPPWMAAQLGRTPPIPRYLYDVLHTQSPSFYTYGSKVAAGNEVAAMPSLHFAVAFLAVLATRGMRGGFLAVAYAVAMALSLVYLGEHYLADEVAGALLAWGCWAVFRSERSMIGLTPKS